MKKIVEIFTYNDSPNDFGGIKTILESYKQHPELFQEQGFDLDFFNYKPEIVGKYGKIGHIIYGFKQRSALKRFMRKKDVSVVHIHTSRDFLFLKDILLARLIRKKYGIPVVITVHVGAAETVFCKTKIIQNWLTNLANKYVDKMLFLSESIRNDFLGMGFNKDRTGVLYNFHDLTPTSTVEDDVVKGSTLRLLYVGAIHREKGIMDLLNAVKYLKEEDVHLDICGIVKDASIKEEFETMVDDLQACVTMHGLVTGAEKTKIYKKADVLILPSYHEGLPMVILEALTTNCAIISTKVGGIPELLDDDNACWVNTQSPRQLAEAIMHLNTDRSALNKMKERNKTLSEQFSIESHINKICEIYSSIINL